MISNALFFHSEENIVRPTAINIGFLRFSLHQLYVSVVGTLIVTPVSMVIVWLFTKSKPSRSMLEPWTNVESSCCPTCCGSSLTEDQTKLTDAFVAKGFYNAKSLTLPHYCVYIAWAVLILGTGTSAFFLFLFSQQWGKAKSEEWLTSFVLSFFESLFVVDPIKVNRLVFISNTTVNKKKINNLFCEKGSAAQLSQLIFRIILFVLEILISLQIPHCFSFNSHNHPFRSVLL